MHEIYKAFMPNDYRVVHRRFFLCMALYLTPHIMIERRDQHVVQLGLHDVDFLLEGNVLHGLGVRRSCFHQLVFFAGDFRFVAITVDTKSDIGIGDVASVDSCASTIVFVTLDVLQGIICGLLGREQRELIGRPSVVAPFGSLVVGTLNLVIGG